MADFYAGNKYVTGIRDASMKKNQPVTKKEAKKKKKYPNSIMGHRRYVMDRTANDQPYVNRERFLAGER